MNKNIYLLNKIEENPCPLINCCSKSDYGDEEICYEDYEGCKDFQRREREGIKKVLRKNGRSD